MSNSATGIVPNCDPERLEEVEAILNKFLEEKNNYVIMLFSDGGYIEVTEGCKFIGIKMKESLEEELE